MDIAQQLRRDACAPHFTSVGAANLMASAADEIEALRRCVQRKQQQYERSQRYWVDAAQKAMAGDFEHLRLRVDLALSGPIEMTEREAELASVRRSERETVAEWMMTNGFSTGHGDTLEMLLSELKWQIEEEYDRGNRPCE